MMSQAYLNGVILNRATDSTIPQVPLGSVSGTPGMKPAAGADRGCSGQALVEYVVIAGMLLATVAIMVVFLGTFREYGNRVLDLVGSEYP
jgi:hypothetical protein